MTEETAAERYLQVAESFRGLPGVELPGPKGAFGAAALRVHGRIFALLSAGDLVVRLPAARVEQLIAMGAGARYEAGKGRPMREWLLVLDEGQDWLGLAREAFQHATG